MSRLRGHDKSLLSGLFRLCRRPELRDLGIEPGEVVGERGAVGELLLEARDDLAPLGERIERLCRLSLLGEHDTDLAVAHRKVAPPGRIACIDRDQPLANGEARAVGLKRLGEIALHRENVADPIVGDRKVVLPLGVARVLRGKTRGNRQIGLVGLQRGGKIALRHQNIADLVVGHGKIALP